RFGVARGALAGGARAASRRWGAGREGAYPGGGAAVAVGSAGRAGALFSALEGGADAPARDGTAELLATLAEVAGAGGDGAQVRLVISALGTRAIARQPDVQRAALRRLADGLRRGGDTLMR